MILHGDTGEFSAGWAAFVQLPNFNNSGEPVEALTDCERNNAYVAIADENFDCSAQGYPTETTVEMGEAGCISVKTGIVTGPINQGVEGGGQVLDGESIFEQDQYAVWNPDFDCGPTGTSGCVVTTGAPTVSNMSSPRIRPIPVFDNPDYIGSSSCNMGGSGCIAKVVNILGFFVEGMCDTVKNNGLLDPGNDCDPGSQEQKQIVGRIVTLPADLIGTGMPVDESSFVKIIRLVR